MWALAEPKFLCKELEKQDARGGVVLHHFQTLVSSKIVPNCVMIVPSVDMEHVFTQERASNSNIADSYVF